MIDIGVHHYAGTREYVCVVDNEELATQLVSVNDAWTGSAACDNADHLAVAIDLAVARHKRGAPYEPIREVLERTTPP